MSAPYSPLAVANEFIKLALKEGRGLEHMKIQKLVHLALGYGLAQPCALKLINENPEVWQYGPVFPSLYQELKYHGSDEVNAPEPENIAGFAPKVNAADIASIRLIAQVWEKYRNYTGFQLSTMMHKEGTPWYTLVDKYGGSVPRGLVIPDTLLVDHYEGLPKLD